MKQWMKKGVALAMATLLMGMTLAGCDKQEVVDDKAGFTVTVGSPRADVAETDEARLDFWKTLSDVEITYDFLDSSAPGEALKLRFSSGDYPEVLVGSNLKASDISSYAANGILLPLDEYINEEDTPNIYKLFQERPTIKAVSTLPDGHIYGLPGLKEWDALYMENALFINKTWLDKLGLEIPTTIDELVEVLRAFRDGDPNGNGIKDEIGFSFHPSHPYAYPEVMLSCWGVACKSGTFDSFCTVQNGEVKFAPAMDEWKELIQFYRDMYKEGILDKECYTHTGEAFAAKHDNALSTLGLAISINNPMKNADEYVAIPPFAAKEGVKPVWRIHPGSIGNRDFFTMTTACKNPKAVMKWIDKFYDFDVTMYNYLGAEGVTTKKDAEGKYSFLPAPDGLSQNQFLYDNSTSSAPGALLREDIGTRVEVPESWQESSEVFEIYADYIDKETWPRPYYSVEEATRLGELQTDIFNLVDTMKAKWTVGTEDIETGWEDYLADLKRMGLDEMMEINQAAYDRYINAVK